MRGCINELVWSCTIHTFTDLWGILTLKTRPQPAECDDSRLQGALQRARHQKVGRLLEICRFRVEFFCLMSTKRKDEFDSNRQLLTFRGLSKVHLGWSSPFKKLAFHSSEEKRADLLDVMFSL